MPSLIPFVYAAGVLHLLIASANFFLPAKIDLKANLAKVSPFIRQVFQVHTLYLVMVSVFFSALCFFFPEELTGGSALGRFLSGFIAFYWFLRLCIQFFYYVPEIKRKYPAPHWFFSAVFLYISVVLGLSATRGILW